MFLGWLPKADGFPGGAPLIERKGDHKAIVVCPNHGELDANINASENIINRYDDKEIKRYTPHKKIKEILLKRYEINCQKNPLLKPLAVINKLA